MTRPGKASRDQALADRFASDAEAAVLRVLHEAGMALTAVEVKNELQAGGVVKADADSAWPRVQRRIRWHDHVIVEDGHRYRWTAQPHTYSAVEALEHLAGGNPPATKKAAFAAIVRTALANSSANVEKEAQRRQAEIDVMRTVAELASEVEELAVKEASAATMLHRVRARVKRSGLEPIDRAGEPTTFDRKRHKPIGAPIRDAAPVVVVRPGYTWKAPAEDVLIEKAIVEE